MGLLALLVAGIFLRRRRSDPTAFLPGVALLFVAVVCVAIAVVGWLGTP
jgi:hypothetical protein